MKTDAVPHVADTAARFFLIRLIPPRTTFAEDMTDDERAIMEEHVAYWTAHLQTGRAIVFGPVSDPKGSWGVAIVRAADETEVRALESRDPVMSSGRGFRYEILPMPQAVVRG